MQKPILFSATLNYALRKNTRTKLVYRREVDSEFNTDIEGTSTPVNTFIKPFVQNATQDSLEWQIEER